MPVSKTRREDTEDALDELIFNTRCTSQIMQSSLEMRVNARRKTR